MAFDPIPTLYPDRSASAFDAAGAFLIGGGDDQYGQGITEHGVIDLFLPSFDIESILDIPEALEALAELLLKLPLDMLKGFKKLIPGGALFTDVPTAVSSIIAALSPKAILAKLDDLEAMIDALLNSIGLTPLGTLADKIFDLGDEFSSWFDSTEDVAGGLSNVQADFTNLLNKLWDGLGGTSGASGKSIADVFAKLGAFFGTGGTFPTLQTVSNQIRDILGGLSVTPINSVVADIKTWFTGLGGKTANLSSTGRISPNFVDGVGGAANIGSAVQASFDSIWSGAKKTTGTGKSAAEVTNAVTDVVNTTDAAVDLGNENSTILAIRDNKALYEGVNETEESTFLLDTLVGATDPPNFGVTASTSTIGFWRAGQSARKGFITYFGKGITSITGIYIDLYKMNNVSGTLKLQLVKSSGDLSGQASSSWKNIIWVMSSADRVDVEPGDVYAFSIRVTGTGTHTVAGKAAGWMPDHALAASGTIPSRPAAVRTAGTSDITMSSITYSGNQPWMGFGIVTGDIAAPPLVARSTSYTSPGTYHYDLLALSSAGYNYVDCVGVGSGGGGCGGFAAYNYGAGGGGGTWNTATRSIPALIAAGATEITVFVPGGGNGGASGVVSGSGAYGDAGSATTFAATGSSTLSCAGGAAGIGGSQTTPTPPPQAGQSPGNITFNTKPYTGGAQQNTNQGVGNAPGGGGAGDNGGFYFGNGGGKGGSGGAFLRAYQ